MTPRRPATLVLVCLLATLANGLCIETEVVTSLQRLFTDLNGAQWRNHKGWVGHGSVTPPARVCSWFGVECDSNSTHLVALRLPSNGLRGVITQPSLRLGSGLVEVDLTQNSISGPLPMITSPSLVSLQVGWNKFSGPVPEWLCDLRSAQQFGFSTNNFTGALPYCFADMKNLTVLDLSHNKLTAGVCELDTTALSFVDLSMNQIQETLPDDFFSSRSLRVVNLSGNKLNGSLPEALLVPGLQVLDLGNNLFSGSIPHSVSQLTHLRTLRLSGNLLTGTIPANLGELTSLETLQIASNQLSGPIDFLARMHSAVNLRHLSLSANALTGTLPREFFNLVAHPYLETLELASNRLKGTIPEFTDGYQLRVVDLSYNMLSGSVPSFSLGGLELVKIDLSNNLLGGQLPSPLSTLPKLEFLDVRNNMLSCLLHLDIISYPAVSPGNLHLLQGNMFRCPLPQLVQDLDPTFPSYVCGNADIYVTVAASTVCLILFIVSLCINWTCIISPAASRGKRGLPSSPGAHTALLQDVAGDSKPSPGVTMITTSAEPQIEDDLLTRRTVTFSTPRSGNRLQKLAEERAQQAEEEKRGSLRALTSMPAKSVLRRKLSKQARQTESITRKETHLLLRFLWRTSYGLVPACVVSAILAAIYAYSDSLYICRSVLSTSPAFIRDPSILIAIGLFLLVLVAAGLVWFLRIHRWSGWEAQQRFASAFRHLREAMRVRRGGAEEKRRQGDKCAKAAALSILALIVTAGSLMVHLLFVSARASTAITLEPKRLCMGLIATFIAAMNVYVVPAISRLALRSWTFSSTRLRFKAGVVITQVLSVVSTLGMPLLAVIIIDHRCLDLTLGTAVQKQVTASSCSAYRVNATCARFEVEMFPVSAVSIAQDTMTTECPSAFVEQYAAVFMTAIVLQCVGRATLFMIVDAPACRPRYKRVKAFVTCTPIEEVHVAGASIPSDLAVRYGGRLALMTIALSMAALYPFVPIVAVVAFSISAWISGVLVRKAETDGRTKSWSVQEARGPPSSSLALLIIVPALLNGIYFQSSGFKQPVFKYILWILAAEAVCVGAILALAANRRELKRQESEDEDAVAVPHTRYVPPPVECDVKSV